MNLPICGSREIHHFFCEIPAIMKISCKDTSTYEVVVSVMGITFIIIPFGFIMASYTFIFLTVLHMKSPQGRNKALVTCFSHLNSGKLLSRTICLYVHDTWFLSYP